MRVAVYTLTRERLEYTEHCFATLREKAGHPFDHFVIDNGSEDGTRQWLAKRRTEGWFRHVNFLPNNYGISRASNIALDWIEGYEHRDHEPYDIIMKVDNDCEVVTDGLVASIVQAFIDIPLEWMALSPRVGGLARPPATEPAEDYNGWHIARSGIVGGLCHAVSPAFYRAFRFDTGLPLAAGQDDQLCAQVNKRGGLIGYIESLHVNHYETTDGQALRFPEYFERKWREEKEVPKHVR